MMRISPHFSLPVYIGEWPITAYTMQIYCASLRIKTDAKELYKKFMFMSHFLITQVNMI